MAVPDQKQTLWNSTIPCGPGHSRSKKAQSIVITGE